MAAYNIPSTLIPTVFFILLAVTVANSLEISNKRLCADKECKATISKAKAIGRFHIDHPQYLSFREGDIILVKSKSAGDNPRLWGGELQGRRGYFDKNFVKEYYTLTQNPQFEVDTEGNLFNKIGKPPPSRSIRVEKVIPSQNPEEKKDVPSESVKVEIKRDEASVPDTKIPVVEEAVEATKSEDAELDTQEVDETDLTDRDESDKVNEKDLPEEDDAEENEEEDTLEKEALDVTDYDTYRLDRGRFDIADLNQILKRQFGGDSGGAGGREGAKSAEPKRMPEAKGSSDESAHQRGVEEPSIIRNDDSKDVKMGTFDEEDKDEESEDIPLYDPTESQNEEQLKDRSRVGSFRGGGKEKSLLDEKNEELAEEVVDTGEVDPTELEDEIPETEDEEVEHTVPEEEDEESAEDLPEVDEKEKEMTNDDVKANFTKQDLKTVEETVGAGDKDSSILQRGQAGVMDKTVDEPPFLDKEERAETLGASQDVEIKDENEAQGKGRLPSDRNEALEDVKTGKQKYIPPEGALSDPDSDKAPSESVSHHRGQKDVSREGEDSGTENVDEASSMIEEMTFVNKDMSATVSDESDKEGGLSAFEKPDQATNLKEKEEPIAKGRNENVSEVGKTVESIKSIGDGIADLQSSSSELQESSYSITTPELENQSTAARMEERTNENLASTLDIEASNIEMQKPQSTADVDDTLPKVEGGVETDIAEGTTFIYDKDGVVITAIMPGGEALAELSASEDSMSTTADSLQQVRPTAVRDIPKLTATPEKKEKLVDDVDLTKSSQQGGILNGTELSDAQPGLEDLIHGTDHTHKAYQSSDFSNRKMLSVSQQQPLASQRHQPSLSKNDQQQQQESQPSVKPTPVVETSSPVVTDPSAEVDTGSLEIIAEVQSEVIKEGPSKHSSRTKTPIDGAGEIVNTLPDQEEEDDQVQEQASQSESTTQPSSDSEEVPLPPFVPLDDTASRDYETEGSGYRSRKINDEELLAEEAEQTAEAPPGFLKHMHAIVEGYSKMLVEKLPPSVQSFLEQEPLGLSPNMLVLATVLGLVIVVFIGCLSCCSSSPKKKKLRATLDVVEELEAKLQLAIKEKENIEDLIQDNHSENLKLKEEIAQYKKDYGKSNSELQSAQLHNETLKKQVATLQEEVAETRERASSKQGEVKQQSKKFKDLERQLKKLEEKDKKLEQESQKLASELKLKEVDVDSQSSKVRSLTNQIGHLQTSKEQLLAEAEDWKEKVLDVKERLQQREEEFRQMQETILFKENELEVLKDCFLQLKSFEENEADGENTGDVGVRVQDKIAAMIDVSKVNASLQAVEGEKNSLANKLAIELDARKELEELLENSRRSVETSMADKMKAERQCQEAQTKLNVLSSYFKEKELQLQRELGEQEALKKQNQNKLVSADETTRSMQQEVELLRTQTESLKRELASSERDFRSQIAANEKKAHENWLAARAAERELKEARHEAGVLRQKLTDIERRQFMGPGGLIRPLPTRGLPPPGMINGPPLPPGMNRSPPSGSLPPLPSLHLRDDDFLLSPRSDRGPPPPLDPRRGPLPPGIRPPLPGAHSPPDARTPPPHLPPFRDSRSPPPRLPPPGMLDGRSPPPYDRRPHPSHMMDRRSPPFRLPPPDMLPPSMRGGIPPPHFVRGGSASPAVGANSPRLDRPDGRYPLPPYSRPPPASDRDRPPLPRQGTFPSPRQQQSQV